MSERIEFTRNYEDLSTNQGFQFEFKRDRCGTGYRTRFQGSALGTAATRWKPPATSLGVCFIAFPMPARVCALLPGKRHTMMPS